jgi:hypothetical protein
MSEPQVTNSQNKVTSTTWWRACFPTSKRASNGMRNSVSSRNQTSHAGKHSNPCNSLTTRVIDVDKVLDTRVVQHTDKSQFIVHHNDAPNLDFRYGSWVYDKLAPHGTRNIPIKQTNSYQQSTLGLPRSPEFDPFTYAVKVLKSIEIERINEEHEDDAYSYNTPSQQKPTVDTPCHGSDSPVRHHYHHTSSSYNNHHTHHTTSSYDNHHHHTSSNENYDGGSSSNDNYGGGGGSSSCDYDGSTD